MKITMLGCGTSVGVPTVGPAGWGDCNSANTRNFRQRCAVLVEKDDFTLLIDAGPDIRNQLLAHEVKKIDAVLLTHTHSDHVAGLDDLRPYYFNKRERIPVYATAHDLDTLLERFNYLFFKSSDSPSYFQPVLHGQTIEADSVFHLGGIEIRTLLQFHGRVTTLGFVFDGRFGYSTDVVDMPEEAFNHLTDLELWIVEMLRDEPHQAHAHFDLTMEWIARCKPQKAMLTHLGLESDYDTLLAKCPKGVEPGYDGFTITL